MFFLLSAAGVHLIRKSATYGLRDSPAPVFLRATRATASLTSMDRCAQSSPSPPAFAKTEHCAPYWETTSNPFLGVEKFEFTVDAGHGLHPITVIFVLRICYPKVLLYYM